VIDEAVEVLRAGGLVASPTETLVGLLADARRGEVVAKVVAAKGRADDAPIGVLVPDLATARALCDLGDEGERLAVHWPGPITIVASAREPLPAPLLKDGKLGMRVPGSSLAAELVRAFGGPLTATSANLSGAPAVSDTARLDAVRERVDLVVEGRSPGGLPSTVVDVTETPPRILRAGAVDV